MQSKIDTRSVYLLSSTILNQNSKTEYQQSEPKICSRRLESQQKNLALNSHPHLDSTYHHNGRSECGPGHGTNTNQLIFVVVLVSWTIPQYFFFVIRLNIGKLSIEHVFDLSCRIHSQAFPLVLGYVRQTMCQRTVKQGRTLQFRKIGSRGFLILAM